MLPVNTDLLKTTPYHADGRPRDPHSHHEAKVRALSRARFRQSLAKLLRQLAAKIDTVPALQPKAC